MAFAKNWVAGSGNWNVPANWNPASVPTAGEVVNLDFTDGVARTVTYNFAGPVTVFNSLTLDLTGPGSDPITLSLPNANLLSTNNEFVGVNGRGVVEQRAGLHSVSADLQLGQNSGSSGVFNVAGPGVLSVTGNQIIGGSGSGALNVTSGGQVSNADANLGRNVGSAGAATVDGPGSQWINNSVLAVGVLGTGALSITNGGYVSSVNGRIARDNGSTGDVTVDGPMSRWQMPGDLTVGALAGGGVGTLTISNQGTVHAGNNLAINNVSSVNLSGGTLRFNTVSGLNRLNFTSGTVQLAGNRSVGSDAVVTNLFGASPTIPSGKGLTVEGQATIADAVAEAVVVDGGTLTVQNGIAIGGAGNGTLQVTNGGKFVGLAQNGFSVGGSDAGRTGSLLISGTASTVDLQSGVGIGIVSGGAGGSMVISAGGVLKSFSGVIGGITAGAAGTVTVTGPNSAWFLSPTSPLNVGFATAGTLNIHDQGLVFVGTNLTIPNTGTVNLDGGILRFDTLSDANNRLFFNSGTIQLAGNRTLGSDAVITRFFGTTPVLVAGKGITVEGTATVSTGLTIFGGALRATDLAISGPFIFGGGLLELTGGTITGLTQLNVPTNGEFRARGVQSLRVAGAAGSTISATGDLTLGDATKVNGFYANGIVNVGANVVTLADANDAAFDTGALVTLGVGGSPGTLAAANGLTLDFGGNVTGYGTVSTPNDVSKPLINNGHISGASVSEQITLSGYVKGVGTFDNVNLTGTFSPGLSPTSLQVGNISLAPTSKLIMELGGTAAGSGYDQLNSSGTITLDGTLELVLINGFIPTAGQTFDLFSGGSLVGSFSELVLPVVPGLTWDISQLQMGLLTASLPGDYNQSGAIDAADYTLYRDALGTNVMLPNDTTPGSVTTADYAVWQANFGHGGPSTAAAVPEPAAFFLVLAAWLMVVGVTIRQSSVRLHFGNATAV